MVKAGGKAVHLNTTNSYTGGTYVNNTYVKGEVVGSVPGPLFIGAGGMYYDSVARALVTNANVTIRREGKFEIPDGNTTRTHGGTYLIDGGMFSFGNGFGGTVQMTGAGAGVVFGDGGKIYQTSYNGNFNFKFYTDVACLTASSNQASISTVNRTNLVQFMDLNTGAPVTRVFDVSNAVGLASTTAELLLDMPMREASGFPATLMKKGSGMLEISRMNGAISGGAVVSNGTLLLDYFVPATNRVCQLTSGSAVVTGLGSTNGLYVGEVLAGSGLPNQAVIKSIDSASQVTLTVNASATTNYAVLFPSCGSLGTGSVTVAGSGTLVGAGVGGNVTVNSGGTLAPSLTTNQTSTFAIGGSLTVNSGGTLTVNLVGATNDVVAVSGNVNITGGTLVVNGPKPVAGTTLPIVTSTNITGTFTTIQDGYSVRIVGNQLQLSRKAPGFVFSAQ